MWLRKCNVNRYFTAISQPLYASSFYSCVNIALAWFHSYCSRRRRARDLFITGAMRVLLFLCRNSPFLLQQFLKPAAFSFYISSRKTTIEQVLLYGCAIFDQCYDRGRDQLLARPDLSFPTVVNVFLISSEEKMINPDAPRLVPTSIISLLKISAREPSDPESTHRFGSHILGESDGGKLHPY